MLLDPTGKVMGMDAMLPYFQVLPLADILELKTGERVSGTFGFWWCGRFVMRRWGMNTLPLERDISKYEHITVCTPVWAFAVCAPIRTF